MKNKRTDWDKIVEKRYVCAVCTRKLSFKKDKKYINLMIQTVIQAQKDESPRGFWYKLSFTCPRCFADITVEYATTQDITKFLENYKLYNLEGLK